MEDDSQANPFPLTCRSHLRSTTIRTLSRILSYCIDDSTFSRSQIASEPQKQGKNPNFFKNFPGSSVSELRRHGNEELPAHGVPGYENSLLDKDSAADGNPEPVDAQDAVFGDEGVAVGGESRRQRRVSDSVEFENRTVEKDSLGDQNPMKNTVVDPIDVKLRPITQKEGNGESIDFNKLDLEIERDRTMDQNPKLNDTQNVVFCGGSLNDRELGQIAHQESRGGFNNYDCVGFETLSVEKNLVAGKMPKQIDFQCKTSCVERSQGDRDVGQVMQQEMMNGDVDRSKLELEKLLIEKDLIMDGSIISISNLDVGSSLEERSVDGGSEKIVNIEGRVDCNAIEFEHLPIEKYPSADGSPKMSDVQNKILNVLGSPVDLESSQVMQHKGIDELLDIEKLEMDSFSIEKHVIKHGNPILIGSPDGLACGSPVDGMGGQIIGPQGSDESVYCGKLALEKLSMEKGPFADGCPKLTNDKDGYFCDGRRLIDGKLRHAMQQEEGVCSDLEFKKLSSEKDPLAEERLVSVKFRQGTQQHIGFIDYGGLQSLISPVEKDLIVENRCTTFDIERGYKQNDGECKQHEMQQGGHQLHSLCYDNNDANSSRPKSCSEVAIIDGVNDSTAAIADQEMEDGEIPNDSRSLMEPDNSILEQVVLEERGEKERKIYHSFTKKRKDFAHTYKEQLRVDKNDMLTSSKLAGSFVSVENDIGRNFKEKKIKASADEAKKSGQNKTNKVKGALKTDSRKTPKMKARDSKVKVDGTSNLLNASDYLGSPGEVSEKIGNQDQGKISAVKDAKFHEKKNRKPLTEERKAKRKLAKKRKRAEQNKKLGVKRLRLQPILKSKVVSDCKFHLKGRCQQGDKCKFSHDAVPLTKSQPCTYFAKSSCLKGDECPFDHQLSKYPCHNYMSNGFCSRGDACLFAHKKPTAEGFSVASNVSNSASLLSLHQTTAKKQLNINGTSHLPVSHALKDTYLTLPKHPKQHVADVRLKPLAQAPEGMRFLSFSEAPFGGTNKTQQDNLPSNKCNGVETSNQQQESESKKLVNMNELPYKSPLSSSQSFVSSSCGSKDSSLAYKAYSSVPASVSKYDSNTTMNQSLHAPVGTDASNNLERNRSSNEFAAQPSAGRIQSRSTDASRILEEFLFSGIN